MAHDNFLDRPLGDYDTRAGATRFDDGDYAGTIADIKPAGRTYNDKMTRVTVTINLDDLGPVVRTMNVAWADETPWSELAHAVFGSDPRIKSHTPREYLNMRVVASVRWGGNYMDVHKFSPLNDGGTGRSHQATQNPGLPPGRIASSPRAQFEQRSPVSAPQVRAQRAPYSDPRAALRGTQRPVTGQSEDVDVRESRQMNAGRALSVVPDAAAYPNLGEFTPGQRRIIIKANEARMPWTSVVELVSAVASCPIGEVKDADVARIVAAIDKTPALSA